MTELLQCNIDLECFAIQSLASVCMSGRHVPCALAARLICEVLHGVIKSDSMYTEQRKSVNTGQRKSARAEQRKSARAEQRKTVGHGAEKVSGIGDESQSGHGSQSRDAEQAQAQETVYEQKCSARC